LYGIISSVINKHQSPIVFGSLSGFFYDLLPLFKPEVRKIDLVHAFDGQSELLVLPHVSQLETRVVTNQKVAEDIKEQYSKYGIDLRLANRIKLIGYAVYVPPTCPPKDNHELNILYVGRGTEEKRVYLIGRAAAKCHKKGLPVRFTFVGDVLKSMDIPQLQDFCEFTGEIKDFTRLSEIYKKADLLVLTSTREGFPLVIMEAMAHGVVPICTNVGGISEHIQHGFNGLLIQDTAEETIVEAIVKTVDKLSGNKSLLKELSYHAYEYACAHFTIDVFYASYRKLLLGSESQSNLKQ